MILFGFRKFSIMRIVLRDDWNVRGIPEEMKALMMAINHEDADHSLADLVQDVSPFYMGGRNLQVSRPPQSCRRL
jgi:hypothetical protein